MEERNNNISAFQFLTITLLTTNALFVGIGIINIFDITKQDAWIVSIIAPIIGTIFILIYIKILNYKPEMNIIEKINYLFGKIFGNIINLIIALYVMLVLVLTTWANTDFVHTIYLTKTPEIFIALTFIMTASYTAIKGIESIARVSEILFFLAILIVGMIVLSLASQMRIDELKPVLSNGYKPIIKATMDYLSYSITPFILLTIIPKNNITNNKKLKKNIIIAHFLAGLLMFFVFFLIPGIITASLASLYRFPAYYVLRKVMLGDIINNVENFLSTHWLFNTFILATMCLYFISCYIKSIFRVKKDKTKNYIIIGVALVTVFTFSYLFKDTIQAINYTKTYFTPYVASIIFAIIILLFIFSIIKNIVEKKKKET
jgi:spore germination protein KB